MTNLQYSPETASVRLGGRGGTWRRAGVGPPVGRAGRDGGRVPPELAAPQAGPMATVSAWGREGGRPQHYTTFSHTTGA